MSSWSSTTGYWVGAQPRATARLSTSPTEIAHLVIAFVVLTFDLALVAGRLGLFTSAVNFSLVLPAVGFGAVAALTGFVAHEMAHKVSAQRHGFWAEFRMSPVGLVFSIVTALIGFLFAAPGATVIGGMGDAREWGRTSLAGPAVNLAEGAAFYGAAAAAFLLDRAGGWWSLFVILAFFNGWFAAFNLIPIGPLDGRKVLRWNSAIWAVSFVVALAFTVGLFIVASFGYAPI